MAETTAEKTGLVGKQAPARRNEWAGQRTTFVPRVDILETPEELRLLLDLPGVKPDGLDVRFERGELTVHGRCAPPEVPGRVLAAEYDVGDYYRAFIIGQEVAADRIEAELKHGVLTIRLPRAESARPRRIAIKA